MPDAVDRHDQEGSRAAGGIEQPFVGIALVAQFVKNQLGEPVGRVVLAQVVPHAAGEQLMVQLLQQVAADRAIFGERARVVAVQPRNHVAHELVDRLGPNGQIPGEQVAFEEVGDVEVLKDAAGFDLFQFTPQVRARSGRMRLSSGLVSRWKKATISLASNFMNNA